MTLRIKSPLRSAEGTTRDLPANPVLVFAHTFTNTAYCRLSATRFYVDNILTRSDISLCNDQRICRCYRLRDLLSLVGGYVFVGAVIIYPTILPPCFSGGNFSLRLTLSRGQPRAKMARSAGRKQKRPVLTHTDHGKHQKANGARSLKNVPRLCISTSLKARFDKRMQPHSMPV